MMRRLGLFLLALLLLSVGFVDLQEVTTAQSVLQVVDTEPQDGQEIDLDETVFIYFDRNLDCDTVSAQTVTVQPAAPVDLACNENAITITPDGGLERATTYTLTVSEVTGASGEALQTPFELSFMTAGSLRVTETLPTDGAVDVAGDATVTVIFNRPVVALGTVEMMDDLPDPLLISPQVTGEGEWLNTSIYTFTPDAAWAGATTYTLSVDDDLVAADGAELTASFEWSFTIAPPQVTGVLPEQTNERILLDPDFQITFNQPMDQDSTEAAFALTPTTESGDAAAVAGTFEWAEDGAGFMFTPDELLSLDTSYTLSLNQQAAGLGGGALAAAVSLGYSTVPAPAIASTDPFDGQTEVQPFGGVTLYFVSPMDVETLDDKVTIEPEPWREPDYFYQSYNDALQVSFPVEPSTDYTIVVEPGMEDIYGNAIERGLTFSFSTAAYAPDVNLEVPGPVGFYNAERDQTSLFVTHRNVSRLDLSLYSVPLPAFTQQIVNDDFYDPTESYQPTQDDLLRRWQIESVAPTDARRYELLDLGNLEGTSAGSVSCPAAPPTRLQVGDTAIVITDPDPLRVRSSPPGGEVIDRIYRDYALPVVGGPVCADDLIWWEVRLRDERTGWVAEGLPDEYFLDLLRSGGTSEVVIPDDITTDGTLQPGIYYLEVSSPETTNNGMRPLKHFLLVADANIVMNTSLDGVTVWATDVETGQPIPDAPVEIYDETFSVIASGTTDAEGVAQIDIPAIDDLYVRRMALLQTGDNYGVGLSNWSDGIDPWRFGLPSEFYPRQYSLYMYTDRPIYRPGQPVYFRGVLRSRDDVNYSPADFDSVSAQVFDDRGEIVYEREVDLTEFGTFNDSFEIADDAPLGFYRVVVDLPSQQEFRSEGGSVSFNVAEYRLPEFQVELTPEAEQVVQGETITVELEARYFFGGLVQNATVEYNVIANPYNFDYRGPGSGYSFVDFNTDGGPSEFYSFNGGVIASGGGATGADGTFTIELPADLEDATQSQSFTIEATVRDESDQTVAGRKEVIVHQGNFYIGVRPDEYVGTALSDTRVEFRTVGWDSARVPDQALQVEVVERRWSSVQEEDPNGRTTWSWEVEEIPVADAEVTTDEDGLAEYFFIPPNGGVFKITATGTDDLGNAVRSSTTLWVSDQQYVSWRQQNSNRIDLVTDRDEYAIGDTAQVLITSPFQGETNALITVVRGDVLMTEPIVMPSNSYVYEFEITEDFAPNAFVSVMIVKGVDESNPVAGFRMGMAQINVDRSRKEIDILVTPDRDTAGPRETVTYTVQTRDYAGEPVAAEVGIGLTDLASLSIGEPNSQPILDFFYGLQAVAVRVATPLTINTDQLTQTVLDTIKGGGGGFGEGGIFDIREEFVDTAYWDGDLVTDEDGMATFEVTLPDNLTTWRLDARAVTRGADGETLVGQDTFDLLSTKPLLIRPVTPRFFVVGDEIILAVVVNNNTDEALSVEVGIEGEGVAFDDDAVQTLVVEANSGLRVNWPVTVENVENVDLTFFVSGGDFNDASKPPLGQGEDRLLPVYRYEAPEVIGTGGVLREANTITETIMLPPQFDVTQGELTINLEPSLAATSLEALDVLQSRPYEGIESVVSRFLPNIMTFRALDETGLADAELRANLDTEVQFAVQRLYAQQKVDGGWGWYVQDRSNVLVTAYALLGLVEARDAGFAVSEDVIDRADTFLRENFVTVDLETEGWRLDRQAFVLYALARAGTPDIARMGTLYEFRDRLSIYAQALLATTYDLIGQNEARTDTLVSDIFNAAITSANGIHWEEADRDFWNWNTDTRTTAIVLQTLVRLQPESDLIPNVVRYLMVMRDADAWETTQETAWAVMALTDWMVATGELQADYDYSLTFNDEELAGLSVTPDEVTQVQTLQVEVAAMLQDSANTLTFERSAGPGNLYYTAYLRAFLPVPEIDALDRGVIVQRRYTLLADADRETITEARIGDVVQVRLTIVAPNDLHYVVVEDPIPAGTDAINPNLATEQQIGTRPGIDSSDPVSRGWGWWWFSNIEFRDEKVVLSSTYLPAGTYEYVYTIRPGLEGEYNVIPPTAREFFFPDVFGRGEGTTFTVLPAGE